MEVYGGQAFVVFVVRQLLVEASKNNIKNIISGPDRAIAPECASACPDNLFSELNGHNIIRHDCPS